jgi:hypothetical protein
MGYGTLRIRRLQGRTQEARRSLMRHVSSGQVPEICLTTRVGAGSVTEVGLP